MDGGASTMNVLVEDLSPFMISRAGFYLYGHSTTPHSHCQHHQQKRTPSPKLVVNNLLRELYRQKQIN